MHDLRGFIAAVRDLIKRHEIDQPGAYRRWLWQKGESTRDLGLNPYGCADAAIFFIPSGIFHNHPLSGKAGLPPCAIYKINKMACFMRLHIIPFTPPHTVSQHSSFLTPCLLTHYRG